MNLETKVEAVLFYKGEPVKKTALAEMLKVSKDDVQNAIESLRTRLSETALRVVETDREVQLTTAPELASCIDEIRKEELKKDIGKAGAETLAIILYRGPLLRSEIDRIRGVNSTFILRNLLIRGLIERRENKQDQRSYLYAPTPALLSALGVSAREELPDFKNIMDQIDIFEKTHAANEESL